MGNQETQESDEEADSLTPHLIEASFWASRRSIDPPEQKSCLLLFGGRRALSGSSVSTRQTHSREEGERRRERVASDSSPVLMQAPFRMHGKRNFPISIIPDLSRRRCGREDDGWMAVDERSGCCDREEVLLPVIIVWKLLRRSRVPARVPGAQKASNPDYRRLCREEQKRFINKHSRT